LTQLQKTKVLELLRNVLINGSLRQRNMKITFVSLAGPARPSEDENPSLDGVIKIETIYVDASPGLGSASYASIKVTLDDTQKSSSDDDVAELKVAKLKFKENQHVSHPDLNQYGNGKEPGITTSNEGIVLSVKQKAEDEFELLGRGKLQDESSKKEGQKETADGQDIFYFNPFDLFLHPGDIIELVKESTENDEGYEGYEAGLVLKEEDFQKVYQEETSTLKLQENISVHLQTGISDFTPESYLLQEGDYDCTVDSMTSYTEVRFVKVRPKTTQQFKAECQKFLAICNLGVDQSKPYLHQLADGIQLGMLAAWDNQVALLCDEQVPWQRIESMEDTVPRPSNGGLTVKAPEGSSKTWRTYQFPTRHVGAGVITCTFKLDALDSGMRVGLGFLQNVFEEQESHEENYRGNARAVILHVVDSGTIVKVTGALEEKSIRKLQQGDRIKAVLDFGAKQLGFEERGTIEFFCNDESLGKIEGPFYGDFKTVSILHDEGTAVTLLNSTASYTLSYSESLGDTDDNRCRVSGPSSEWQHVRSTMARASIRVFDIKTCESIQPKATLAPELASKVLLVPHMRDLSGMGPVICQAMDDYLAFTEVKSRTAFLYSSKEAINSRFQAPVHSMLFTSVLVTSIVLSNSFFCSEHR